ncbi:MAG: signal recognition particle-docking protein FtsY [Oscillospiraceae bacterium]
MGFFDKIKQGLTKTKTKMDAQLTGIFAAYEPGDEEFFEDLEETLILADTGVETTTKAIAQLRKAIELKKLRTGAEVKKEFVQILTRILKVQDTMLLLTTQPSVVLVVGVNGVGKTTTIGKLAAQLKKEGNRVLLSAADTFRAAAADQLTVWAQRAGVDIVKHEEGSDPAAVVFDSIQAAKARGTDVVIIDTAGRLHNKTNLMNELNKITRVIRRELPEADIETLMVLDATTGQNGLIQAKQLSRHGRPHRHRAHKARRWTAKGGIVFAIANDLQLPVKYVEWLASRSTICLEFKPAEFVEALLS